MPAFPVPYIPVPEPPEQGTTQYRLRPVELPGFSGPLDLLLSLIEEERLDVAAISLASVTDQYLKHLESAENLSPEHLADFLVVASTLLLLKSRRLFPDLALTEEEEERVASLESQLREYRRFREAGLALVDLWNRGVVLAAREGFQGLPPAFYPPPGFTIAQFRESIGTVVSNLPRLGMLAQEVVRRIVSIEERIRDIQGRITAHARFAFEDVQRSAGSKLEIIVSFLALLELVKQRLVVAEQTGAFRDILVLRPEPHGPPEHT